MNCNNFNKLHFLKINFSCFRAVNGAKMINDAMNYRKLLIAHRRFRLSRRDRPCLVRLVGLASSVASRYHRTLHLCPAIAMMTRKRCKSITEKFSAMLANRKPLKSQQEDSLLTLQWKFVLCYFLFEKTKALTSTSTINQICVWVRLNQRRKTTLANNTLCASSTLKLV